MHPADELIIRREHGYRGQFLRNLSSLHKTCDDQVFICKQGPRAWKKTKEWISYMHVWVKSMQQNTVRDGGKMALNTVYNFGTTLRQLWDNFGTSLRWIWDGIETILWLLWGKLWDNFRTTLRHLTLITLMNFGTTLRKLWDNFVPRWWQR